MLTAPVTNPNMPAYAKWTVDANQARMDLQYLQGSGNSVEHWAAVCAAWKVEQTKLRDASPDPEHYSAPFNYPVPEREISDWSDEKQDFVIRTETHPELTPIPALDQYVKPAPAPSFPAGGAQAQQVMMLNMLAQALTDLKAIKAKVGA